MPKHIRKKRCKPTKNNPCPKVKKRRKTTYGRIQAQRKYGQAKDGVQE